MKRAFLACAALAALHVATSNAPVFAQSSKKATASNSASSATSSATRRADQLFDQAFALENQGRLQEAEPLYAEVLRLRREALGETHADTIHALNGYGYILQVLGRSAEAEPIFARVVELSTAEFGELDDYTLIAMANRGRALMGLGRFAEAEVVLAENLQKFREAKGDRDFGTITTLSFYASVLEALGRPAEAAPLHAEVLQVRRKTLGSRHPETIAALGNYALVLMRMGRVAEAEPIMAEAVQTSRAVLGDRALYTINMLANHGGILEMLDRQSDAEPIYREALTLSRDVLGERHPTTLVSINNLGNVLKNTGRYEEAERLMDESERLHIAVLGEDHPDTIAVKDNHVTTLVITRQWQAALTRSRELTQVMRSRAATLADQGVRGSAQRDREFRTRQDFEKTLADVLWGNRNRSDIDPSQLPYESFTALQLASAGSTSRAVREAAAARFASGQGLAELVQERQQMVRAWQEVEASLIANEAGGAATGEMRSQLRAQLSAIDARIAQIDERLAADAPQYFAILSQQAVDLEALREVLGEDEAVLFLVPSQAGVHAMAINDERIDWNLGQISERELPSLVEDYRSGLEIGSDGLFLPLFDLPQSHRLYTDLIAPIEDALKGKKRVYVIADGALSRVPLGTLTTSAPPEGVTTTDDPDILREADWLADRYALVQLPSLQSLVYIRTYGLSEDAQTGDGFAGFGAPVLGGEATTRGARSATLGPVDAAGLVSNLRGAGGMPLMNPDALRNLSSLPGTKDELEQVRTALRAPERSLFLADAMTESAVRGADLSRTAILHFATHGFTSEESGDAAEPGLVFTPPASASAADDGYLAASEVVSLNLAAARWVILSACNTASPSGAPGETGLSGLAQAFFYAGAQSLMVSHWPVFDDIAPVLTVEALRRSQAGMPRAEALQAAMRQIREDPALDAAHPAVWAPFTLVGEGR